MDNLNTLETNIDDKITNAGGPGSILAADHNAILKEFARKSGKYTGAPFKARKEPDLGVVPAGSMFWNNNALNTTADFIITISKITSDLNDIGILLDKMTTDSLIRFKDYSGRSAFFDYKSHVADLDSNNDDIYNITISGYADNTNYNYQVSDDEICVFDFIIIANGTGGGADGDSAYEVAVNNGFVGTEPEWLLSLEGTDGVNGVDGLDGSAGTDGTDGQGVPVGGTANQILEKIDGTDFNTQWVDPSGGSSTVPIITLDPTALVFDKKEQTFDYIQSGSQALAVLTTTFGAGALIYGTWVSDGSQIIKPVDMEEYSNLFSGNTYSPNSGDVLDFYLATLLKNGVVVTRLNIINLGGGIAPSFNIDSFSGLGLNTYVDINLSEGGYGANDGSTPISSGDFSIVNFTSGGATAMSVLSVEKVTGGALTGGETSIRVNLSITGTPNGLESFEVRPTGSANIYNAIGTAMLSGQTSGVIGLVDNTTVASITGYSLGNSGTYLDVSFSRGVWGDNTQTTPVQISDLQFTNTVFSGATAISIGSLEKITGGALTGGETSIRITLNFTGIPDGAERFEIQPVDGVSIFDSSANSVSLSETTGTVYVLKQGTPVPLVFQIGVNTANINESPIGVYNGESATIWNNRALADQSMPANSNGYLEYELLDITDNGDLALIGFNNLNDFGSESGVEAGVFRTYVSFGNEINSFKNNSTISLGVSPFVNSKIRVRRSGNQFITEYTKGNNDQYFFGNVIAYTSTALHYVNMFIVDNNTSCSNPVILQ